MQLAPDLLTLFPEPDPFSGALFPEPVDPFSVPFFRFAGFSVMPLAQLPRILDRGRRCRKPVATGAGFTLVELLVVVGIITVLIALLLPVLAKVRDHANRVKCAANLHSMGQALVQYAQQSGYYPACILASPNGDCTLWPLQLRPFLGGDRAVFHCPSRDNQFEWNPKIGHSSWPATEIEERFGYDKGEPVLSNNFALFSYGYNWSGAAGDIGSVVRGTERGLGALIDLRSPIFNDRSGQVRLRRVKVPSDMIAVTDSNGDGRGDVAVHPSPDVVGPGKIHNRGANVLFCDGHVLWYLEKDITVTSGSRSPVELAKQRMWNSDHEPTDYSD